MKTKHQKIIKQLTLLLFLTFNISLFSQDIDLIKIHSAYYPQQAIEESSVDGEIGFFEWGGQFTIPQAFKNKKTVLLHKLGYSNLRVDSEANFGGNNMESEKYYHSISYNLGLIQTLSTKWRLMVNLNPTIASDLEESLGESDWLYQANALAIYSKNKQIKYGLGVAFTTRFGRQIVVPTGMFKYNAPKMSLDVLLPNRLSLMFNTKNRNFYYGIQAALNGGLFNNNSDVQTIGTVIDEAGYSRLNVGPSIAIRLKDIFKINLSGGMSVGRRLEFIDAEEDTIDRTPESGPYFRIGFSVSPKKKSTEQPGI